MVDRAIEKTNLGEVQKRLIGHLSKGFKQRVGIAQAIVSDPEVLILDEPTVGLDPKQVAEIRELIKSLKGQHTIVLSTHILPEVQATCEKIIIINKGTIVAQDSIQNLATMEKGQSRLHIRLRKDVENMKALLADMKSVVGISVGSSAKEWQIDIQGGEDVVDSISSLMVQKGYGLIELSPKKLDLEDVFLKLTYGEGQSGGPV
jgi:ABC-2 type transport system ATP-binding protein